MDYRNYQSQFNTQKNSTDDENDSVFPQQNQIVHDSVTIGNSCQVFSNIVDNNIDPTVIRKDISDFNFFFKKISNDSLTSKEIVNILSTTTDAKSNPKQFSVEAIMSNSSLTELQSFDGRSIDLIRSIYQPYTPFKFINKSLMQFSSLSFINDHCDKKVEEEEDTIEENILNISNIDPSHLSSSFNDKSSRKRSFHDEFFKVENESFNSSYLSSSIIRTPMSIKKRRIKFSDFKPLDLNSNNNLSMSIDSSNESPTRKSVFKSFDLNIKT